ncbi:MAG: RrF2 family transcriptional regulator [Bacteroidota bacterium]|jgi:Rrf2 family protein
MLSKKAKYAVHALIHLAKEYDQGPVVISVISDEEHIPKKFLETILLELKNAGIVNSKKGRNGGYYLIKDPEEVNMADVHRLFDGAIALLPCVTYQYYERCEECQDEETCAIRKAIKEVRDQTVEIMKRYSLAELMKQEDKLEALTN